MKAQPPLYLFLIALSINFSVQAQQTTKMQRNSWVNLPVVKSPTFKADTFNIVKYGAKPDGLTLNTKAINDAISNCSQQGGGVVLLPAGIWLSGPVVMKSNVNLHLESAATLLFTTDKSEYALVEGIYEGRSSARNQPPLSAENAVNIAITGSGIIDGNGDVWRAVGKGRLTESQWKQKVASGGVLSDNGQEWYPSEQFKKAKVDNASMLLQPGKSIAEFLPMKDFLRPNLLVFNNCKLVLLEGVTFQNSPAWCLHPLLCEELTIRNVQVKNPSYAQNGDGIDLESCRNFLIEGCTLSVGDDAICIKSGKDEEGRKRAKPTENGIVRNNIVYNGHGGFVVGSEMSGGARNIFVENCTFIGTDKGLRFKSVRGRGGVVESIFARNIYMLDIVQEAIFFDMFYFVKFATDGEREMIPVLNEGTPIFKDMHFENIVCKGAKKGVFIRGLSEMPIQNISMENLSLQTDIGVELIDVQQISLKNIALNTSKSSSLFSIDNGKSITIANATHPNAAAQFLTVSGSASSQIKIIGTDLKATDSRIVLKDGLTRGVLSLKAGK